MDPLNSAQKPSDIDEWVLVDKPRPLSCAEKIDLLLRHFKLANPSETTTYGGESNTNEGLGFGQVIVKRDD